MKELPTWIIHVTEELLPEASRFHAAQDGVPYKVLVDGGERQSGELQGARIVVPDVAEGSSVEVVFFPDD